MPTGWQHVITWGGLRGAISLALALSLPAALGTDREQLRVMAFGVVLFTLLVQATTMRPFIRWLHIIVPNKTQMEYETDTLADAGRAVRRTETALDAEELAMARCELRQAQRSALLGLHQDGAISEDVFEKLVAEIDSTLSGSRESLLAKGEMEE